MLSVNNGKYELQTGFKIGGGSFGEIFFVKNLKTNEELAGKIETAKEHYESSSQLRREAKIYTKLRGEGGKYCFLDTFDFDFLYLVSFLLKSAYLKFVILDASMARTS
jgi:serine/threonine protein kinase